MAADLASTLDSLDTSSFKTEADRVRAVDAARALVARLQTPWEVVEQHCWEQPFYLGALYTLIELKLFAKWKQQGGGPKSSQQLADMVGADPALLARLIRFPVAMKAVNETAEDTFELNAFSKTLARPEIEACYSYAVWGNYPAALQMSQTLADGGYKNPRDSQNTAFIASKPEKKDMHFFGWLMKHTARMQEFDAVMTAYSADVAAWVDYYPAETLLPKADADKERVTVVDVGGGRGHDLEKFRKAFAGKTGRLVLQDQAMVIPAAVTQAPIETTAYDFFTPQPIKGATAYYMHSVLHDWPKDKAQAILKNQMSAMTKDSKLLINDKIVPLRDPSRRIASFDMTMMALGSAAERTLPMWEDLLSSVGLKINKIHKDPMSDDCVIEVVLP